ncbi:MAG TPA: DUF72 domain-containing protein [Firmicutes bacterium]|jgi:uncharacterized protein YecE (DUF72 family)|nr:DUF72 domain-containing protein [Bacillota bacterium]
MILIATSGYYYNDWNGTFYPSGLPANRRLEFYADEFPFAEINATYYRQPAPSMFERMLTATPDDFRFVVKAYKGLTHERQDSSEFLTYLTGLRPLVEAGRLICVLAQFPYSFHNTKENRDYIECLRDRLAGLPVAVEFRNRNWFQSGTFELLSRHGLAYVAVDAPRLKGLIPPLAHATTNFSYVRFHGRNAHKWYQHEHSYQRYDYTYDKKELQEWVPKLKALEEATGTVYVTFNNHYQGKAVLAARDLAELLGQKKQQKLPLFRQGE